MVLGAEINLGTKTDSPDFLQISKPTSINTRWVNVLDANGPATADNAGSRITNPGALELGGNPTTHILGKTDTGTVILLRLGYDDGLSGITDMVVQVFGRTIDTSGDSQEWQLLKNNNSVEEVTIKTEEADDITDGILKYTTPDLINNTWDTLGCNDILVAVKTALAGAGDLTNSILQAKLIN